MENCLRDPTNHPKNILLLHLRQVYYVQVLPPGITPDVPSSRGGRKSLLIEIPEGYDLGHKNNNGYSFILSRIAMLSSNKQHIA